MRIPSFYAFAVTPPNNTNHIDSTVTRPETYRQNHAYLQSRRLPSRTNFIMPAPTALQRAAPEEIAQNLNETPVATNNEDDEMLISTTDAPAVQDAAQQSEDTAMTVDSQPLFAAEKATNAHVRSESRKVAVPPHRWTPLKNAWPKVYPPLVEHLKLQCRVNTKNKNVELRTSRFTDDTGALQKGADFIHAFCLGFDLDDAIALLRLDDLYIETFEIKDVKTLQGEHLGRAIGSKCDRMH